MTAGQTGVKSIREARPIDHRSRCVLLEVGLSTEQGSTVERQALLAFKYRIEKLLEQGDVGAVVSDEFRDMCFRIGLSGDDCQELLRVASRCFRKTRRQLPNASLRGVH